MTQKLDISGLTLKFGQETALENINLSVPPGESIVFMGASGSGKTVLLKCLLGLIKPTQGKILLDGVDVYKLMSKDKEALLDGFGMLFQRAALFDSLPVWRNVAFRHLSRPDGQSEKDIKANAVVRLTKVGLTADVADLNPSDLSGGMQKRAALARAFASDPEILLLDEPTAGLDPIMTNVISEIILDNVRRLGATVLSVTSDLRVAEKIADRIVMLDEGRVIWTGTAAEITSTDIPRVQRFVKKWAA
jgi:phospholipid/cholesterol/gamma-HCH transport system ATP-binding protein